VTGSCAVARRVGQPLRIPLAARNRDFGCCLTQVGGFENFGLRTPPRNAARCPEIGGNILCVEPVYEAGSLTQFKVAPNSSRLTRTVHA
jgi:hypothetical protein